MKMMKNNYEGTNNNQVQLKKVIILKKFLL